MRASAVKVLRRLRMPVGTIRNDKFKVEKAPAAAKTGGEHLYDPRCDAWALEGFDTKSVQ